MMAGPAKLPCRSASLEAVVTTAITPSLSSNMEGLPRAPGEGEGEWMANHASTRTTQLYDRRRDEVSLDEVERIVI
jgi:hypothetical protein